MFVLYQKPCGEQKGVRDRRQGGQREGYCHNPASSYTVSLVTERSMLGRWRQREEDESEPRAGPECDGKHKIQLN